MLDIALLIGVIIFLISFVVGGIKMINKLEKTERALRHKDEDYREVKENIRMLKANVVKYMCLTSAVNTEKKNELTKRFEENFSLKIMDDGTVEFL